MIYAGAQIANKKFRLLAVHTPYTKSSKISFLKRENDEENSPLSTSARFWSKYKQIPVKMFSWDF